MQILLLSGGSGKRLWPLSNDVRSKQFLKLLDDGHGGRQSMVRRVYEQIKTVYPDSDITIATNAAQIESIHNQLPTELIDIVIEPERRDTFPAIVLACAHMALKKGIQLSNPVVVLPVDSYTELGFFHELDNMIHTLETGADIVLMGIPPQIPTSKYGYIIPGDEIKHGAFKVSDFVEKPDEQLAAELIRRGAYWNGGVFAFKLGYIMDIAGKSMKFKNFEELLSKFASIKKTSFDYEVVEKADSLALVPYKGKWTDIGTWRTLTDEIGFSAFGEVVAEDVKNTYVINELSLPVIALGTKDLIVAASPDGILVSDLICSSNLKSVVDRLESVRPMYEERRWGEYTVYDSVEYGDYHSLTKHLFLRKGKSISYQTHKHRDEIWIITNGLADFVLDGVCKCIHTGDVVKINAGQKHAARALKDLHIIEVQLGELIIENDIEKFSWNWN